MKRLEVETIKFPMALGAMQRVSAFAEMPQLKFPEALGFGGLARTATRYQCVSHEPVSTRFIYSASSVKSSYFC